jgi:hypothetical protein
MMMIHYSFSHLSDSAYASFVNLSYQNYLAYQSYLTYTILEEIQNILAVTVKIMGVV